MPIPKRIFLPGLLALFFLGLFIILRSSFGVTDSSKTWEIIVTYNNEEESLSLKKLTLLNRRIRPNDVLVKLSPYEAFVVNSQNALLYKTKIHINEMLAYSIASKATTTIPPLPTSLDTPLYIPYQKGASKIRIEKNGIGLLDITLTKETSAIFIPEDILSPSHEASAETCSMQVVLISDGYADRSEFEQDADTIQTAFKTVEPFNTVIDFFDFELLYNTTPLDCATKGPRTCVLDSGQNILERAIRSYPNAAKVLVLAKSPPDGTPVKNGVLGTAFIGGPISVAMKAPPDLAQQFGQILTKTAIHEFLGHSVGKLYDRYVFKRKSPTLSDTFSNCSPHPLGESFWQEVRTGPAFPGCLSPEYFAPYQNDCNANQNPNLGSAGRSDSVMSATGCTKTDANFDPVEQYYLKNTILPLLTQACPSSTTSQPTSAPTPTPTIINIPTSPLLFPTPVPTIPSSLSPHETFPPTSVPYECHEENTNQNNNSEIQLKTLVCQPK